MYLKSVPGLTPNRPGYAREMTNVDAWPGMDIWQHADQLIQRGRLHVDRACGSAHPVLPDLVYPLDYGYIEDTRGGDGEEVDVWLGSGPDDQVTALACTIDPFRRDAEVKLFYRCTPEQIQRIRDFYAPQSQASLIVLRPERDETAVLSSP